jgi:SprT protein
MYLIFTYFCRMITEQDIPQSIIDQIRTKIRQCIKIAEKHYNRKFSMPKIDYSLTGSVAAQALSYINTIKINPTLLVENEEDYISQTIPHEVAHIITDIIYPRGHLDKTKKTKRYPHHGTAWKYVMELFGVPPTLYHNYATTSVVKRHPVKYEHKCSICGKVVELNVNQSALARSNSKSMYHTPCGPDSKLIALDTKIVPLTKFGKCEQIYLSFRTATRTDLIQMFMTHAKTTLAGSGTYYATLRKKYDR